MQVLKSGEATKSPVLAVSSEMKTKLICIHLSFLTLSLNIGQAEKTNVWDVITELLLTYYEDFIPLFKAGILDDLLPRHIYFCAFFVF